MLTICSPRARISARMLGAVTAVVAAALLVPSGASAASVVTPPTTWKVLTHQAAEACMVEVLLTWPRVPGEYHFSVTTSSKSSKAKPVLHHIEPTDVRRSAGKVYDRAPKGMHQYRMRNYIDGDCDRAARLANGYTANVRTSLEVATRTKHFIEGTVEIDCAKQPSCPRASGVEGVKVTAGTAKTTTTAGGHYIMKASKGVHTVRADAGALAITTKPQRVDLRKRTTGTADFKGCGLNGPAALRAVGGGTWEGGNEDCLNYFKISWRGSANALSISWVSMPKCATGIGKPKVMVKGGVVDPAKPGHNLIAGADAVSFMYPLDAPEEPNNVHGELLADGTGTVTANAHIGQCTYGISNLKLKRG